MPRKIPIKEVVLVEVALEAAGQHYPSLGMQTHLKNTTRLLYTPTQRIVALLLLHTNLLQSSIYKIYLLFRASEFQITSSTPRFFPSLLVFDSLNSTIGYFFPGLLNHNSISRVMIAFYCLHIAHMI